jgi:hypothetical protein|tara:strand:- start:10010 stop:10438 length:429 start_codon:yes stop_codon:yes gene_type:complete
MMIVLSLTVLAADKHFERNQLPQLNQEILDASDYSYEKVTIPTKDIIPVQTQRVRGLRVQEKGWLLNDEYRPLVVDQDNYLIDGHHRLDGIKELQIKHVRVLRVNASIEEIAEAFNEFQDHTSTYEPVTSVPDQTDLIPITQ